MNRRKTLLILAIISILFMLYGSLINPNVLMIALITDPYLPMGTIAAWFALMAFAGLPLLVSQELRKAHSLGYLISKYVSLITLLLAFLWPFVARLLAGNWNYTFSPKSDFAGSVEAGYIFDRFTMLIPLLTAIVFLLILAITLWGRFKSRQGKTETPAGK